LESSNLCICNVLLLLQFIHDLGRIAVGVLRGLKVLRVRSLLRSPSRSLALRILDPPTAEVTGQICRGDHQANTDPPTDGAEKELEQSKSCGH
jgi:hypothetical protein